MHHSKRPWNAAQLFLAAVALCLLASLGKVLISRGYTLQNALYNSGLNFGADFFNHMWYVREPKQVYTYMSACFPPFAYCFYWLILRTGMVDLAAGIADYTVIAAQPLPKLYFVLLFCLGTIGCLLLLEQKMRRFPKRYFLLTVCAILFSNVWLTGILERGNSVLYVILLLMLAAELRTDTAAWKRELALICIAAAAGLKLYPAVFGVLYIKERRWKETIRLIVYGAAFFALPFLFFGGWEGFRLFLSQQQAVHAYEAAPLTIGPLVSGFLTDVLHLPLAGQTLFSVRTFASVLAAVIALTAVVLRKGPADWKDLALVVGVMILCPLWSGNYTLGLLLLPLAWWMEATANKTAGITPGDAIAALLFAGVFWSCYFAGGKTPATLSFISALLLFFLLLCDRIVRLLRPGTGIDR